MEKVLDKVKQEGRSFFGAVSQMNEVFYLVLLTVYVSLFFVMKIAWQPVTAEFVEILKFSMLSFIIWGAAIFLFVVIATWRDLWQHTFLLILTAAAVLALACYFSFAQSTNLFSEVLDIFFCVMAFGRDYRKILRCLLVVTIVTLVIAALGVPLCYTYDLSKPNYGAPSHSLGIEYPNSWGYLALIALLVVWYLYLRRKYIVTFALFWASSAFMYLYLSCHTIAILTAVFPFTALLVDLIEGHFDKKAEASHVEQELTTAALRAALGADPDDTSHIFADVTTSLRDDKPKRRLSIPGALVVATPIVFFIAVVIVSLNVDWVYLNFYGTPLKNFAMRFVQTGLYFKTFGVRVLGNSYYNHDKAIYADVCGVPMEVSILDSSFGSYFIMRGWLWMVLVMIWMCLGNFKALKKRDYAIPMLTFIFLCFAAMERPGLEAWYNFTLLYPLAKVLTKPGADRVFELPEEAKAEVVTEVELEAETAEEVVAELATEPEAAPEAEVAIEAESDEAAEPEPEPAESADKNEDAAE